MLKSGCIRTYQPEEMETSVSVMSRHTLTNGVTPDPEITSDKFNLHWPELGPDPNAIGRYYRGSIGWEEFRALYLERLASNGSSILRLAKLADLATERNVAVLCVEPEPLYCHRRLLIGYFGRCYPDIEVQLG